MGWADLTGRAYSAPQTSIVGFMLRGRRSEGEGRERLGEGRERREMEEKGAGMGMAPWLLEGIDAPVIW